jgi:hypothetical protein
MSRNWWVAGLAILAMSVGAAAQNDGLYSRDYTLDVKWGHETEFEAAIKEQVSWYRQNRETWHWHLWQYETGPHVGDYIFRSPSHTLEEMDQRSERAQRARANFMEVVAPHLDGMSARIMKLIPELTAWPEDASDVRMVTVLTFKVNYGMNEEFEHIIGRIHGAFRAMNSPAKYAWVEAVSGDASGTYLAAIPHRNYADIAPPPQPFWEMIRGQIGSVETAALRIGLMKTVKEEHSALLRFREDLSYMPQP